jgi:hypothetical protein
MIKMQAAYTTVCAACLRPAVPGRAGMTSAAHRKASLAFGCFRKEKGGYEYTIDIRKIMRQQYLARLFAP